MAYALEDPEEVAGTLPPNADPAPLSNDLLTPAFASGAPGQSSPPISSGPNDLATPSFANPSGPANDNGGPSTIPAPSQPLMGPQAAPQAADDLMRPTDAALLPKPPGAPGTDVPATSFNLPPPPKPPTITGDPTVDVRNNLNFQRELTDYHGELTKQHAELTKLNADTNATAAQRQADTARELEVRRQKDEAEYNQIRAQRQAAIDASVAERASAQSDLTQGYWANKSIGQRVFAALMVGLGGIGAGMQNAAAAKIGQVGHAENEAFKALKREMDLDYQKKKDRLASASDAVLEARYGFKDAADNHRAAQNDIDADTAANYQLIAKDAAAEIARRGGTAADIASNEFIIEAKQKQAEAEGHIHEREEAKIEQRRHDAATERAADRRLGMQLSHLDRYEQKRQDALDKEERRTAATAVGKFDTDWNRTHGASSEFGKTRDLNVKLNEGLDKAKSSNPEDQNFALQDLARIVKGGTLTQYASQKDTAALGGTVDQVQAWLNKNKGKGMPKDMQDRLVNSYHTAIDGTVQSAGRMWQGDVDATMSPNSGYYGLKGSVEDKLAQSYSTFKDREGKNPFQVQRDQNAPNIDRTTGRTTYAPAKSTAPKPDTRSEPGPSSKLSPDAINALDWLAKHPKDPDAPGVRARLKSMGAL